MKIPASCFDIQPSTEQLQADSVAGADDIAKLAEKVDFIGIEARDDSALDTVFSWSADDEKHADIPDKTIPEISNSSENNSNLFRKVNNPVGPCEDGLGFCRRLQSASEKGQSSSGYQSEPNSPLPNSSDRSCLRCSQKEITVMREESISYISQNGCKKEMRVSSFKQSRRNRNCSSAECQQRRIFERDQNQHKTADNSPRSEAQPNGNNNGCISSKHKSEKKFCNQGDHQHKVNQSHEQKGPRSRSKWSDHKIEFVTNDGNGSSLMHVTKSGDNHGNTCRHNSTTEHRDLSSTSKWESSRSCPVASVMVYHQQQQKIHGKKVRVSTLIKNQPKQTDKYHNCWEERHKRHVQQINKERLSHFNTKSPAQTQSNEECPPVHQKQSPDNKRRKYTHEKTNPTAYLQMKREILEMKMAYGNQKNKNNERSSYFPEQRMPASKMNDQPTQGCSYWQQSFNQANKGARLSDRKLHRTATNKVENTDGCYGYSPEKKPKLSNDIRSASTVNCDAKRKQRGTSPCRTLLGRSSEFVGENRRRTSLEDIHLWYDRQQKFQRAKVVIFSPEQRHVRLKKLESLRVGLLKYRTMKTAYKKHRCCCVKRCYRRWAHDTPTPVEMFKVYRQ